jgi:cobalt-zinc-cadmium efflux system protein
MEGVPQGINPQEVSQALIEIEGVNAVHDLHIWSLSSTSHALAAHVDLRAMPQWQAVLPQIQRVLHDRFGIEHSTLQPEDPQMRADCVTDPRCGVGRPDTST